MLKVDVESFQSGANSGIDRAVEQLKSAKSSASAISVPSGFSMADAVRGLASQIEGAIGSLSSAKSAVASTAASFRNAESANAHVVDTMLMSALYSGSSDFFSFSRAEALGNPAKIGIIVNNLEKTSPQVYNQVISNIAAGTGVSNTEAQKIFKSIKYDKTYMNTVYNIIDQCEKNPWIYSQVLGYPKLVGSDVVLERPSNSNAMSLYMDLFVYSNLSTDGGKIINIDENGTVSIKQDANTQKLDKDTFSQFTQYMQYVTFARTAKVRHEYIENNGYSYWTDGDSLPEKTSQMPDIKKTVCSAYVYWACVDAKYLSKDDKTFPTEEKKLYRCSDLVPKLKESGFYSIMEEGESIEETLKKLQPGDILCYGIEHIQIYAGGPNGMWNSNLVYNAGSDEYIQNESPREASEKHSIQNVTDILRVPEISDVYLGDLNFE